MYLVRMVYASRVNDLLNPTKIHDILTSSKVNNLQNGITGVLCFNKDNFLQCLEGSRRAVNKLYTTIAKDERHKDIVILDYKEIWERSFEKWAMGYIGELESHKSIIIKYCGKDIFDPFTMSGESAYRLLYALSKGIIKED